MSKRVRFSLSLVLALTLSTPLLAAPRDREPRGPFKIITKIVRLIVGIVVPNDEGIVVPIP